MRAGVLAGTVSLTRLAFRRERIRLLVWLGGTALLVAAATNVVVELSPREMIELTAMRVASPALRAFDGPLLDATLGEVVMLRVTFIAAVLAALIGSSTVIRHTRENEETGCAELLGSTPVGRYASLATALVVATAACMALAVLLAAVFAARGLAPGSSLLAGAAFGGIGLVSAAIGAVSAQLSETTRGAAGLSGLALLTAFLINAVGNMLGEVTESGLGVVPAWPVWASPFGWIGRAQAYGRDEWWVLALFLALTGLVAGAAVVLQGRRDVGASVLPARRGPAEAPSGLLSPLGLAWRLQRGLLLGWAIPAAVTGAVFGAISEDFGVTVEGIETLGRFMISADVFLQTLIAVFSGVFVIYTVQALLRLRSEEVEGPLESVLATPVTRIRWAWAHTVCALSGSLAIMLVFALGISLGSAAHDSPADLVDLVRISLYQMPAVVAIAGFTVAVFGLLPRWTAALAWAAVLVSLLTGPFFGPLFDLPGGLQQVSPFSHQPLMLANVAAAPLVWLCVAGGVLAGVGLVLFSRRDIRT